MANSTPEAKLRISEKSKESWTKPGYRENQKIKQSQKWGDPTSGNYKLKGDYLVYDPNGKVYEVKGLKKFCRENKLDSKAMYLISNGKKNNYKGWTVVKNPSPPE